MNAKMSNPEHLMSMLRRYSARCAAGLMIAGMIVITPMQAGYALTEDISDAEPSAVEIEECVEADNDIEAEDEDSSESSQDIEDEEEDIIESSQDSSPADEQEDISEPSYDRDAADEETVQEAAEVEEFFEDLQDLI